MTTQPITIDDILTRFFAATLDGKSGVTHRRIETVRQQLRLCVEVEAARILVDDDLRMLSAERQFNPEGAVARVMHADDLIFLLSIFVEPRWQPPDTTQRALQLQLTGTLTGYVLRSGLVDPRELACPILDIEAGINRGHAELRSQRRAARAAREAR